MRHFSVVIADTSGSAKNTLNMYLKNFPQYQAIASAYSGEEAIDICHTLQAEVLFLSESILTEDETLSVLMKKLPTYTKVVFIATSSNHTVEAFEFGITDYLVAPYSQERFANTIGKLNYQLERIDYSPLRNFHSLINQLTENQQMAQTGTVSQAIKQLIVKDSGKIRIVNTDEINWIGGAGNYVELNLTSHERPLLHRETLSQMQEQLAPFDFIRIHRSTLVKKSAIKELKPTENGDYLITLSGGQQLNVSRRYKEALGDILR